MSEFLEYLYRLPSDDERVIELIFLRTGDGAGEADYNVSKVNKRMLATALSADTIVRQLIDDAALIEHRHFPLKEVLSSLDQL